MSSPWRSLAMKLWCELGDIQRELRNQLKHGERKDDFATLERVYTEVCRVDHETEIVTNVLAPEPRD